MNNAVASLFEDAGLVNDLTQFSRIHELDTDEVLMASGDTIVFLPIVLDGVLRVIRQSADDKEVFLYHLYPRQTCAVAISCCMAGRKSTVKAVAEQPTSLLLVPVNQLDYLSKYTEWTHFINSAYATRFGELLDVIDLIAFHKMDVQLFNYLLQRKKANNTALISITHQQIADELHSHREAISRLLRTMEEKGLVRLGRNAIELLTDKI